MEEDKYSLLYPDESEKERLLNMPYDNSDPNQRDKIVLFLSIIASNKTKYLFQLYHDEFVITTLQDFQTTFVNEKTNPVICTFTDAKEAVTVLQTIFSLIREFNLDRGNEEKCDVQAALHFGEVVEIENDIFGEVMNVTSKIHSVATGNLIFLSRDVFELLDKEKEKCHFIGGFHFKGLMEPTQIFSYDWSDDSPWLNDLFENHKEILLEGDPKRYRIIHKKLDEHSHFKPLSFFMVDSIPTGAQVWLDDILIPQLTPITVKHKIGDFTMRVAKKGYRTIEKKVGIIPQTENSETIKLDSILGSISIQTDEPGYTIFFNGKILQKKTPHLIKNLMPEPYTIELRGDTHYTNPQTFSLQDCEHHVHQPDLIAYGRVAIVTKLRELDFLIKDGNTHEKIKLKDDKFSYTPTMQYQEGKTDEILLKEGEYELEPLENKYPEVKIEVKHGELSLISYDELIENKKLVINTGKYHTDVCIKHQKTGLKMNLTIKGRKKIALLPGNLSVSIQNKFVLKEYKIELFDNDAKIDFVKDILPLVRKRTQSVVKKIVAWLFTIGFVMLAVFSYMKHENNLWADIQSEHTLSSFKKYLDTPYFFRYKKLAEKTIQEYEEQFWQVCKRNSEVSDFETYLLSYSEAKYHQEAQVLHQALLQEKALAEDKPNLYRSYLTWYPTTDWAPIADSLLTEALWSFYEEKNSMFYFSYFIWKYPTSPYLDDAIILREEVFYSMITPDFWLDKWQKGKSFILSKDNYPIKLILIVIFLAIFFRKFWKGRSKKV